MLYKTATLLRPLFYHIPRITYRNNNNNLNNRTCLLVNTRFMTTTQPTHQTVTAAACIIGDEILNGKTRDSNAHFLGNINNEKVYRRPWFKKIYSLLMFNSFLSFFFYFVIASYD